MTGSCAPISLAEAIREFVSRRLAQRLSPGYVGKNQSALNHLLEHVRRRLGGIARVPLAAVTREDLVETLLSISSRGLSGSSLRSYMVALRVFMTEYFERGFFLENLACALAYRTRRGMPARYVPTQDEVRRLLAAPDVATNRGLRDRAVLELAYGSGLRKAELLSLEVAEVDLSGQTVFIREGKGKKDRLVPITKAAARWMGEYVKVRRAVSFSNRFFLGHRSGRPLDRTTFHLIFRETVAKAELPGKITLHSLRHACALHLLEGGADVVAVKNLLGHARLDTTAKYLKLTTGHLARALARSHPRG